MQNNVLSNFYKNVVYLINNSKISELAERLELSPTLISNLKNGELHNPSLKLAVTISKYFNISLDDLMFKNVKIHLNNNI